MSGPSRTAADAREAAALRQAALDHAPYADGPADFAIGLRPVPEHRWFEGGEADPAGRKDALYTAAPQPVWAELPGSRTAQGEALFHVKQSRNAGSARSRGPPLLAAARLVADDLCLLQREEAGWRLTALSLCAGSLFTAEAAIGKTLAELHAPVPGFGDRFLARVARIFDQLRPETILERRNWSVSADPALHLPSPAESDRRLAALPLERAGEELHLRMERQTLRKLPRTGAVLFTIRVWGHPLAALTQRPGRVEAFAAAWAGATADYRAYKRLAGYDQHVAAFLAEAREEAGSPAG